MGGGAESVSGKMMDSKCCLIVLCLSLCSAGTTSATGCQSADKCGCKSESSGAAVDLAALDSYLVNKNQPLSLSNSTVQYYLQLCSPLKLAGNCSESSNSTVCSVNGTIYTSYGRSDTVSYGVDEATQTVNVMFNNGDPVGGAFRQVDITIFCGYNNTDQTTTQINTANDTYLNVTIFTNLQCVTSSSTSPSSTSTHNAQTSVVMPTNTVSVSTLSPTPLPTTVPVQPSPAARTTMTAPDVTVPMLPSLSVNMTVQPSPSPSPSVQASPSPSTSVQPSPPATMSFPAQPSSNMSSGTVTSKPGSALPPSPSQTQLSPQSGSALPPPQSQTQIPQPSLPPSPSETQPSTNSTAPALHSTSVVPSCPPQPSCQGCTKKLALSLGVAIPSTAVVTLITTILFSVCCQKARKGRKYIRLAPTVYFDEEDRD